MSGSPIYIEIYVCPLGTPALRLTMRSHRSTIPSRFSRHLYTSYDGAHSDSRSACSYKH